MKLRIAAAAVAGSAIALSGFGASATTVTTVGNQTHVFYNNTASAVDLGDFNLAVEPVAVTALFTEAHTDGSLVFGVFSDPAAFGASGSVDVNLATDSDTFSGSFDGVPLVFTKVDGDFVASFSTTFSGTSDIADFVLNFEDFDPGDEFQVNVHSVSAIPLPASLPLFLAALGGLGYISRRRKLAA